MSKSLSNATRGFLIVFTASTIASAQVRPSFDVASIKRHISGDTTMSAGYPPGRFLVRNLSMRSIIAMAYGEPTALPVDRVIGGPDWLDTDKFDIEGKTEAAATEPTLRAMARSFLENRLRLVTTTEQRQLPIYALVIAGGAAKRGGTLRPSDGTDCKSGSTAAASTLPACGGALPQPTRDGLELGAHYLEFEQIARMLQPFVDRPLVNRTALPGRFSFTVTIPTAAIPGNASAPGEATLEISRALQDQLGLRLESTRGPVDVRLVVSVQRPTKN